MERPATCRDGGEYANCRSTDTSSAIAGSAIADAAGATRDSQALADNRGAATPIGYTQAIATNAIGHSEAGSANTNAIGHNEAGSANTDGYSQAGTIADGKAGGTDGDTNARTRSAELCGADAGRFWNAVA